MGLKGKFIRVEGTGAVFGSQKKPEWKPIDIAGSFDRSTLEPGQYYDLDLLDNRLVSATKLAPRTGGSSFQPMNPPQISTAGGSNINQSLLASATGFAKSCLESGVCKTPVEAARAGLAWAALWDKAGTPKWPGEEEPKQAPKPVEEFNDEIPF